MGCWLENIQIIANSPVILFHYLPFFSAEKKSKFTRRGGQKKRRTAPSALREAYEENGTTDEHR